MKINGEYKNKNLNIPEYNDHGFTLIEVLVAVVILAFLSIAFARLSIIELQALNFNNQREEAFQLARQEAIALTNNSGLEPSNPTYKNGVKFTINVSSISSPSSDLNLSGHLISVSWFNNSGSGSSEVNLTVYTPSNSSSSGGSSSSSNSMLNVNSPSTINAPYVYVNGNVIGSSLLSGRYDLVTNAASYMNWTVPSNTYLTDYQHAINGVTSQGTTGQTTTLNGLSGTNSYNTDWYLGNVDITGSIVLSSGDFIVDGNVTVGPGKTLKVSSGNLLIKGSLILDNGASVVVSSKSLEVEGDLTVTNGTIKVSSGNAFINGNLNSSSTNITISSQNLVVGGSYYQNGGQLTIPSGNLYIDTNQSTAAQFNLSNGGIVDISSGNIYSNAPLTIDNSSIDLSTGSIYLN